ncbi:MAG TPA: ATP-binding protein [Steroidobacteraceae bacterium]|nr:ATP-binding protein [Steroidobacteraceae bacterium]
MTPTSATAANPASPPTLGTLGRARRGIAMRNLYVRIFLSFWTAMVLVLTLTVAVTLWLSGQRMQRLQARQDELAREASMVLTSQGVPGLRNWLQREIPLQPAHDRLYVLDQHGVDILGRLVPEFLLAQVGHRPQPQRVSQPTRAIGDLAFGDLRLLSQLVSPTNETYALSLVHRFNLFGVFGFTETPIVALLATLLAATCVCFLLARYLSDPVRHLRAATRSIAAGDLRVRVSSLIGRRHDELALLAYDFDAMAERLRNLIDSQRQLLRDVSHELRSPLARLQIALGLARRPHANLDQELDRIEQEAQRLDELIGEILSLSRLEDPARELIAEPVDLEELLEALADNARVEAEPRFVRVDLAVPSALSVAGDRELLFRALENVVRNALSHAPNGSTVELSARAEGGQVIIRVSDQGPGVPPDLLERIFEPFFRVGKARDRDTGGHGIGLAITSRVVGLHAGTVRARNLPAGGLQVEIVLPRDQAGTPALAAPGAKHAGGGGSSARDDSGAQPAHA